MPAPPRFTFPFHYQPHPLAVLAAEDLQGRLTQPTEWRHDFGLPLREGQTGSGGKMFGVLVVETVMGKRGYLAAHSGKLAERNDLPGFVPPIFDLLDAASYYTAEAEQIHQLTLQTEAIESSSDYLAAQAAYRQAIAESEAAIAAARQLVREGKLRRKQLRAQFSNPPTPEQVEQSIALCKDSIEESYRLKRIKKQFGKQILQIKKILDEYNSKLTHLRNLRAASSQDLQERIFDSYTFLSAEGERRGLGSIFADTVMGRPPAGAGECAAPKLLQYAYLYGLRPLALAEFWWGEPPASSIRHHRQYYPACRGKCLPILGHMLRGLSVDPDPLRRNPAAKKYFRVVYEDDSLIVVDKPAEFLSVPGRHLKDSVATRLRTRYPEATGPMVLHRLDMSTSGLLVFTKTEGAHRMLQRQFNQRSIEKRYAAVLDGLLTTREGTIDLPLYGNPIDRPRQMVCAEQGKAARTHYRVIQVLNNRTLIYLYPITGRTHQLRVHAAHPLGLGRPIVGDDLYGTAGDRLFLHAERITLRHPDTQQLITFCAPVDFSGALR